MLISSLKTSILIFLVLLVASSEELWSYVGKYPIQHFSPSVYQAGNQNIGFAQNRDMTLFVANNLGVLSFNGKTWKTHAFRTGKKKRSLAFDERTNRLYVGLQGDFGYFKENWEYVSLVEKIPPSSRDFDEVWDVYIVNSEVFFCTFRGIYGYDGESIYVIQHEDGLERSFYTNEQLFSQSPEGRLFKIDDRKSIQPYIQNQTGQIISGVLQQNEGLLLFYNSGEIELSTTLGAVRKYEELIEVLRGTYVNHVMQLSDTRLAISTQTAGLFLYDIKNKTIENISTRDGLATNACLRSFQDYSGNLWLGLQNGIAQVRINSPLRLTNQEINLQGSGYETIETEEGTYYSTSNGLYYATKEASQTSFLEGTEGPAYGFQIISDRLYAGHHTGLFLLEKNIAKRVVETDGLWRVKQLKSNPRFAIGGTYSGLHLFRINEEQQLISVQDIGGFNESSRFFEEDQDGDIWVGQYYKGLYKLILSDDLRKVSATEVTDVEDAPKYEQIVLSRADNDLIVATNSGVFQVDQSSGEIVSSDIFSKSIGDQQVYLFEQDNKRYVHLIAEDLVGYFRQISPSNYVFVHSSLHQLRYYLNNDLLNISINTDDGVYFSSNEGFIYYNPELESQTTIEYPIVIRKVFSITQDSALYELQPFEPMPDRIEPIVVNHHSKMLQFNVESFQFNDVNNQQFRYYLKGFDQDYSAWTNMPSKEYSNLSEGQYEFTVQTRNYLGVINTSQSLILEVKPPFHRSLFAKISYVLFGISGFYLFYTLQSRYYKKKADAVEEVKKEELAEEQRKRLDLKLQKEQELTRLHEEKLESELKHLNNLLATSTMNLVVKNEFIESIKQDLEGVMAHGKNMDTKRSLKGIVRGIDTTLKLQEDWDQFELHFNQVHGDFLIRLRDQFIELSPNEQKLCAFLRLNLNTKDIANLMSISLRGVEVARYRLRKKLNLQKGQNLSKYILEY